MTENSSDRWYKVAVMTINGVGLKTFQFLQAGLAKQNISWAEWWSSTKSSSLQKELGLTEEITTGISDFKQKWTPTNYAEWLAEQQIQVCLAEDEAYPRLLLPLDDRPVVLYVKGQLGCWQDKPVAVVGSRRMTTYGFQVTRLLTQNLVWAGATIISGLMYGVDLTAHQTAINEQGITVGVLGYGLLHPLQKQYQQPVEELIALGGAVVSEFAPLVAPNKGTFPQRNRIVAGMSLGVVVTEAAQKSGSTITVERALDYGRSVFAVPGPFTNPFSEGTKELINAGATLVTRADDIMQELGLSEETTSLKTQKNQRPRQLTHAWLQTLEPLAQQIMVSLESGPHTTDQLVEILDQPVYQIMPHLSSFELEGYISRIGDTWQSLIRLSISS
jgi:DNA processing protein